MEWVICIAAALSPTAFWITKDWFIEKFGPDAYIVNRSERRDCSTTALIFGGLTAFFAVHNRADAATFVIMVCVLCYFGGAIFGMWAFNDRFQVITARQRLENPRRPIPEALPAPAQIEAAPITLEHDEGFAFDPARFGKVASRDPLALPSPDMNLSRESMTKPKVFHTKSR